MPKHVIELISFKLCPYVNRSVITLLNKGVDFDITHIDIFAPPEWFLAISPRKKVPVLKIDNEVIFESAVINELLDEITDGSLHPSDPIAKAKHRAWIEFGSDIIMTQYHMVSAKNSNDFEREFTLLQTQFALLDQAKSADTRFFNSDNFLLIDAAFAPIFIRQNLLDRYYDGDMYGSNQHIKKWADALLTLPEVSQSVVGNFTDVYLEFFKEGYFLQQYAAKDLCA